MLVPVSCDLWLGNHLSRAHFHSASRMASRSQQWPIIPHTVDEKLPAVIFDQPDPRAPWFYEHRQVLAEREPEFEQLLGWDALAVHGTELAVWQLAPGGGAWTSAQIISVPVIFGSSG